MTATSGGLPFRFLVADQGLTPVLGRISAAMTTTVVHYVAPCPACKQPADWTQQQPSSAPYHQPICQCPCQDQ